MRLGHRQPRSNPGNTQSFYARFVATSVLAMLLLSTGAGAQNRPTEYQVKAAFLFNFGKFVKWPPSPMPGNNFAICVLGSNPFGGALDSTVAGERIDGKPVTVRRIDSAAGANACRIVFVSESERSRLDAIVSALSRSPVLTVSDADGFVDHAGMIQFVMDRDRVRFQVNLAAAEKAGLVLSSELLKVATSVKRGESGD